MRVIVILATLLCVVCSSASYADARPRHHRHTSVQKVHISAGCSDPVMRPCYQSAEKYNSKYNRPGRRIGRTREFALLPENPAIKRMGKGLRRVMAEGAGRVVNSDLIARARSYLGTNPTGWRRLWCARFMSMVAPRAAARIRNPNAARAWAHAGRRIGHCEVGAIAVLVRGRRGGHVGVVTACGPRGPRIVSGNHGHRVGESVYSARRVLAFVDPRRS